MGTPHNDFPVLINITDPTLKLTVNGGHIAHASAYDIAFRNSAFALLDWEVEKYDGAAGTLIAWVRIPSLPAGAGNDTIIYLDYGDCTVTTASNTPANVWNAYRYVYHMNQSGAANPLDSSSFGNVAIRNPTLDPGIVNAYTNAGRIGDAIDLQAGPVVPPANQFLPSTPTHVAVNDGNLALNANFTMETWVRFTSVAPVWVGIQTKDRDNAVRWAGIDRTSAGLGSFIWQLPEGNVDGTTVLSAGTWYHIAVRYNGSNLRQIFVNGVLETTSNTAVANGTLVLPTRLGDDSNGNYLVGQLDEVRCSNAIRAAGYIQTSFNNQSSPGTFYTVGAETPIAAASTCGANGIPCASLGASTTATTVTVTAPGAYEITFDNATGGQPGAFYDLLDDPGKTNDLAGGTAAQLGLFTDEVRYAGISHRPDKSLGRAELLEITSARAKVRSEAPFQRNNGTLTVPGLRGIGDYSLLPSGRMAIEWERQTAQNTTIDFQQIHLNVHYQETGILSGWGGYTQSGPILFNGDTNPPGDEFVMTLLDQPVGRTDFQMVLHQNWPAADTTYANNNVAGDWAENTWFDTTAATVLPPGTERWSFLTFFKPTDVFNHLDARAVSRSADYRAPDTPVMAIGQGWFDTNEDTVSPSDFFNEGESSYLFDLDPLLGLRFDMDGGTTIRNRPFLKVRQWRSLAPPATINVGGALKTRNADYRADVKPVARAYFAQTLAWHCDLDDPVAANNCQPGSTLDVGGAGSVTGPASAPGLFGRATSFTANNQRITSGTAGGFDFNVGVGAIDFWYQPASPQDDGARHIFWNNASGVGQDCFVFEKTTANTLRFSIVVNATNATCTAGGTTYSATVPAGQFAWQGGQWIHLKTAWRSSGGGLLEIYVNGILKASAIGYNAVGATHGQTHFGGCPGAGTCPLVGGDAHADGVIDEPTIYIGFPNPNKRAVGGLTTSTDEYLADLTRNTQLNFLSIDGSRRGSYFYMGADSKFRGLNVALSTPGAGIAAGDLDWEYWDGGSWADLETTPGFTDQTNSFTRTGSLFWTSDPAGWAPFSVDGSALLYYVRVHLKPGISYGTFPMESAIKTDILLLSYCSDITLSNQTVDIAAPMPTAVDLVSFTAQGMDSAVELEWKTSSELKNLGFHLYRSTSESGPYERITSTVIPGLGSSPSGASYHYTDSSLENGVTFYYKLEDIETTGGTKLHGPVSATPLAGGGSPLPQVGVTVGEPERTLLQVKKQTAREMVLELRTEGFEAEPQPDGSVRISIPGFSEPSEPGAPAIPVLRSWLATPAGRGVRVASVRAEEVETFSSLRPTAEDALEAIATRQGTIRAGRRAQREGAAFRRAGMYPESLARVLSEGYQGETKKTRVELSPLRWNRSTGELSLARKLTVRLVFTGREPTGRRENAARGKRSVSQRLVTRDPGLYGVRYEEIGGGGRRGISASSLRLSRLGKTVAFHLERDNGVFAPGSRLYFLSEGASLNPYGNEAVYELESGASGESMPSSPDSNSGQSVSFYWQDRSREENRYYQAGLLEADDLWMWDVLVSPAKKSYPFEVSALAATGETPRLSVWLQGVSDLPESPDHHVRVEVNGSAVFDSTFEGKRPLRVTAEIPAGVLREGENELSLENVGDTGAAYSMVMLDRFTVSYPRNLVAEASVLEGGFGESGVADVEGLPGGALVLDVTEKPARWVGKSPRFAVEAGRRYLVVAPEGVRKPELASVRASSLMSPRLGADYLVLGPRGLLAAAKPLLELRRRQGLRSRGVAIEDVYSEFGFGETRPEAVREFLAYGYEHWQKPAPRYVLLLGDASYDFKDYLATGVKNQVPPWMVKTSYLWTASDPGYAAVHGEDDLPDVAVGRLPAANVDEARVMVEKILAYESTGSFSRGPVVLVADNADEAGNFEEDAEQLANGLLESRNPRRIYLSRLGTEATRGAIADAFDEGASLLSYLGHGGIQLWAMENVFDASQVSSLEPQTEQPFVLTLNCLNGYFHFPYFNSLAEELVKAEGRGAIAAFSPSGLSLNEPAQLFHRELLRELLSGHHRRLGDAVLAAQETYAGSGAFPELLGIYHLLGDPALEIR